MLYRYTYKSGDYFYETSWSDNPDFKNDRVILKTETKEIEID